MTSTKLQKPFYCISTFLILILSTFANAQILEKKSGGDDEQALVERWHKAYDEIIDSIQIESFPPSDGLSNTAKVELKRETILSISNPAFEGRHGRVYLWTENGRPVVLSAIMSTIDGRVNGNRLVTYEFNSLSQNPVTAARNDRTYWNCTEPGVKWQSDLEESLPSASRTARLTQMRSIARGIEASKFRLMTTPLYRYPVETPDVTDGAIFAFANGTDPGVFLLIEARQNKWYLACSPSNIKKISVKKGTQLIESFEYRANQNIFQTTPFYQVFVAQLRPANDPSRILRDAWLNQ